MSNGYGRLRVESGQTVVAAAGTAVQLTTKAAGDTEVLSVTIKALSTNGGLVYVGGPGTAAANGHPLSANETQTYEVTDELRKEGWIIDLSLIWLDAAVNGEGVSYTTLRM